MLMRAAAAAAAAVAAVVVAAVVAADFAAARRAEGRQAAAAQAEADIHSWCWVTRSEHQVGDMHVPGLGEDHSHENRASRAK
jgi:hypothetical protein